MSEVKDSGKEEAVKPDETPKGLTPQKGMAAMQGTNIPEPVTAPSPPELNPQEADLKNHNRIKASDFTPETSQALKQQGLDDSQNVLADSTGKRAEQLSSIVISKQGLPDGSGGSTQFQNVIPGQYNVQGNGIDLIGVTSEGKPVPIEVKKRANADHDSIGADTVKNLNLETETLLQNIELERHNNPVLARNLAEKKANEPDTETSPDQMSDLWVRDRWISLVKNDQQSLEEAGIKPEYLNLDELVKHPYSDAWKQILDSKHTVIVSSNKEDVSTTLLRQAALKKGSDVSVIDLTA